MNILVTGGGTVAAIDDVRRITNASTGRFSAAISEAALRRGARVWHLHAPGAIRPLDPPRLDYDADFAAEVDRMRARRAEWLDLRDRLRLVPLAAGTVAEYAEAVRSILSKVPIDVAFLAMAASDYAPDPARGKLASDPDELVLRCRRLPKVIRAVRDWAPGVYLVGFKLLSGSTEADLIDRARRSGEANRADLTVANDLGPLRAGRHTIHLVRPGHPVETIGPPSDLAAKLVDRVRGWARGPRPGGLA